jgi:hypothetical protein
MTAPVLLEGDGHFDVDVIGESHYQDNLEAICGERNPDGEDRILDAVLVLDDANPYDPNAVRVDIEGQTVGYLSRDVAPHFREYMANLGHQSVSFQCQANIRGGWDRGGGDVGRYGVWLDLPREPAVSAPVADAIPKKKPRRWIKIIGLFILVLFFLFVACVVFGLLLQLFGVA